MAELSRLKEEADHLATLRGHVLRWSSPWHGEYASLQGAMCEVCEKELWVTTKPMPNEVDIGGEAVALTCTKENDK